MSQETIEQTFQVPTPAKLKLENVRGSVVIQPAEDGLIRVTAVKHLKTGDADQNRVIKVRSTLKPAIAKVDSSCFAESPAKSTTSSACRLSAT
jgi:hypothetical protein